MSTDPNLPVVVFVGTRGAGKSAVINMLENLGNQPEAKVGNDIAGVTHDTKEYLKVIEGQQFRVFDTIGLGEPVSSGTPTNEAFNALFGILVPNYAQIRAVVYVARVGRFDTVDENNYRLVNILCRPRIPVVLVLTHAEEAFDVVRVPGGVFGLTKTLTWWEQNKPNKVDFADHACLVASLGPPPHSNSISKQYIISKSRLRTLLKRTAENDPKATATSSWAFWNKPGNTSLDIKSKLPQALKFYGMEKSRADAIADLFGAFKGVQEFSINIRS